MSFRWLYKVHETAWSAVCLPAPAHTFADLRFVCSYPKGSTAKADCGRQTPFLRTYAVKSSFKSFKPPEPLLSPRHCRQFSTYENPIYEASFAEFLTEREEEDDMGDAKSVASTTSSGKRKRNAGPAFYAVRVGRTPGIYYSWSDCEAQIKGMKAECRQSNLVQGQLTD